MNPENFNKLCEKIEKTSGFRVYGLYENNLKNIISNYASFMMTNEDELIDLALNSSKTLEQLIDALLVNETYFFRHSYQFDILRDHILPELRKEKSFIKIWSAGCSTGCEPYTIAMIIDRYFPSMKDNVYIIGTDLSMQAIDIAREGVFSKWHIRNMDKSYLRMYFDNTENKYFLKKEIKNMVTFKRHNLLQDSFITDCSIIFCRNVLIYFNEKNIKKILRDFIDNSLIQNGYLFLAPGEFHLLHQSGYETILLNDNLVFKKSKNKVESKPFEKTSSNTLKKKYEKELVLKNVKSMELLGNKDETINYIENIQSETGEIDKELLKEEILVYLNNKDFYCFEKRLREYKDFLSEDEYYFLKGISKYQEKKLDEAIDFLRKAVLLKDDYIYNLFLAFALIAKNDFKIAKYFLNMALSLLDKESSFESLIEREIAKKIIIKYLHIL